MKKQNKIRIQILCLCCALVAVFVTAIPLFNRINDAQMVPLLAGAVGAGAMLTSLIRDLKEDKGKKE